MISLQDIFCEYGDAFLAAHKLSEVQHKAYHAILNCRTQAMGCHIDSCDNCGHEIISYNSCRNRNCPKCQTFAKEMWIKKQENYLLGVGYFHVVFTVPSEINALMLHNQPQLYNLFFRAVKETLLELGANPKHLGATIGATCILHTWGQNLSYHPHIHCIIPAGGLKGTQNWVNSRKKFFIPVKVLSAKFRGKFLALLREMTGQLLFIEDNERFIQTPGAFDNFFKLLYSKPWVTYVKKPFKHASCVINYLGRYTHKIAISENRIIKCENGRITFKWRDYRNANKNKLMTLDAVEFIRRFMMHVLPARFTKIRHVGILASRNKTVRIALCQKLTHSKYFCMEKVLKHEVLVAILGEHFNLCPVCKKGSLSRASPSYPSRLPLHSA